MPDLTAVPLELSRLSLFVLNRATGVPVTRLPVYTEIVWTERQPPPPPDDRFEEMVGRALANVDTACDGSADCHAKVTRAFAAAAPRAWPADVRDQLRAGPAAYPIAIAIEILRRTLQALNTQTFSAVAEGALIVALDRQLRTYSGEHNLAVNPPFAANAVQATYPLGVLATDHAGYASYDIARLPSAVKASVLNAVKALRADPTTEVEAEVWLYPLSAGFEYYELLRQCRFTTDAIVGRLEFTPTAAFPRPCDLGLPAMQAPSLADWRLSPASFASNPAALVGDAGCESLIPANLALQEYRVYQVVRLTDVTPPPPALPAGAALGVVHDYRIAWYALGHSLGQILYSLPLAPAESVNLAVIDWTRSDQAQRDESSTLTEQVVHDQRRDRTISETVKAAIREYQEGSSFMAGVAQSVGASGTAGAWGIAAGLAGAIGGTTSDSSGSRDLSANTVQQLSERIAQASSAMREFQSTVVVQSTQAEKQAIETRTIVNYNHSHALTILYYEVLRHFRIATELVRFRPAVLVKLKTDWFEPANVEQSILVHRTTLEGALLEDRYKQGFEAFARTVRRASLGAATPAPDVGGKEFNYFTFYIKTGGQFAEDDEFVNINATLLGPGFTPKQLLGADAGVDVNINPPGSFRHQNLMNTFTALSDPWVKRRQNDALRLRAEMVQGAKVSFKSVKIVAYDSWGGTETLVDVTYDDEVVVNQTASFYFPLRRAPAEPGKPVPTAEAADDAATRRDLEAHLLAHKAHYSRAIVLAQNPLARAEALEQAGVLAYVENRPLDVVGEWVAYPCTQPAWSAAVMAQVQQDTAPPPVDERLVTLPARGVFAEAKLGHCNASEEIDNTRFWDWQQSPIPHFAPEIAPVQPVTPQPQQQNLAPTPFPQSLVNIVNPPNAPDPTGMAAALTALAAPNIFRDMSGRAETADLLKRLSDNSIKIAEASSKARGILASQGSGNAGGGSGGGTVAGAGAGGGAGAAGGRAGGSGSTGGAAMAPGEQLDRMQVVRSAVRNNELTPEQGRQEVRKIVQGTDAGESTVRAGALTFKGNGAHERAFFPPKDTRGETYLIGRIEGAESAQAQFHTSVADNGTGGSVEWRDGGGMMRKLFARRPGVCGVEGIVFAKDGTAVPQAYTTVSVPLFVHVTGAAADLQAALGAWHLDAQIDEVMRRAEMWVRSTVDDAANVRFVWNVDVAHFAQWKLPPQFQPGGDAEQFYTRVRLANTSATGQLADIETTGAADAPAWNGTAQLNLAKLESDAVVGSTLTAIVNALATAAPPPALEPLAVELVSRLIASLVGRTMCAAVLGQAAASGSPTFSELTGYQLATGADASDPASYTDLGVEALRLRAGTIAALAERLPVPPKFE